MVQVSLKKIISRKQRFSVINQVVQAVNPSLQIQGSDGTILLGDCNASANQYPIEAAGEVIGWVLGEEKASAVASIVSYIVQQELEKKSLANELLEKYQEIDLFQDIFTQITASLNLKEVAQLVIEEAGKLIESTSGAIFLLNQSSQKLESIANFGQTNHPQKALIQGEGIIGGIVQNGKGEIVNDVPFDPRLVNKETLIRSLICVPLKTKEETIGAIAIFNDTQISYSAGDLKRLTMLALQAAVALENALLHEKQLEESRREALIFRLANQIHHSLNLDTILETAVSEIRSFLDIDCCLFASQCPPILCIDQFCPVDLPIAECDRHRWQVIREAKQPGLASLMGYYSDAEMKGLVPSLRDRNLIRIDHITALNDSDRHEFFFSQYFNSVLAVPIQISSGRMGLLICANTQKARTWSDRDIELLQLVANQLAIALDLAELYDQTRSAAFVAETQAHELQRALYELQQTQTQLIQTEKMSSLGQLVAGIAHEINNPVNFVCGNLSHAHHYTNDLLYLLKLYQRYYSPAVPEIQAYSEQIELEFLCQDMPRLLSSMHLGVERIRDLVLSLRNFSRLDQAEKKPVDIHEGIESTLLILQHRLKSSGKHSGILVVKEYGILPQVECYPSQLNQVFMNLLSNAIDALENQQKPGIITIRTALKGEPHNTDADPDLMESEFLRTRHSHVVISIEDNGPGISQGIQANIFDPFFTTKPVGKGTGLGLSISHQIIQKHGGTIECISQPDQGTQFLIEIPVIAVEQSGKRIRSVVEMGAKIK